MNHYHQQAARPPPHDGSSYARHRPHAIAPAVPAFIPQYPTYTHHHTPPHPQHAIAHPPPPAMNYQVYPQQPPPPPPPPPREPTPPPPPPPPDSEPESPILRARSPFRPPLPWVANKDVPFPPRRRRRKAKSAPKPVEPVEPRQGPSPAPPKSIASETTEATEPVPTPSESDGKSTTSTATAGPKRATIEAAVPVVTAKVIVKPAEAKVVDDTRRSSIASSATSTAATAKDVPALESSPVPELSPTEQPNGVTTPDAPAPPAASAPTPPADSAPAPAPAKQSWAELLRDKKTAAAAAPVAAKANGSTTETVGTLAEVLKVFRIENDVVTPFLEPRGLINTGNMCFMNAVLQVLVFCGPFYFFLERVGKVAQSFKNDTPLVEAMIMFMRNFRVLRAANSKLRLKSEDLEAFGEPFAPEEVYEQIRKMKSFAHMRRGLQQDAEEFLGFLLDGLHEEAVKVLSSAQSSTPKPNGTPTTPNADAGWLEVGHKQKAATTRTTEITETPISRIFGGKLRSEFRVPGIAPSVTLEPYTPLQLDIQPPEVKSVTDALKHLTWPEKMTGDFNTAKGPSVTATKQVFIDSTPQVLILHLKRFCYDNQGGTQKIWKNIAYPLELTIPREAMAPNKRNSAQGMKYRLIGVVYHHGKSAQGGHYTVDVNRGEGGWVRIDDTVIEGVAKDLVEGREEEGEWREVTNANGNGKGGSGVQTPTNAGGRDRVAYILFYQRI